MAGEAKRGCGYRQVGGIYLVGDYIPTPCDRLPFPLPVCPCCGQGVKVGRGMTEINPFRLFGLHDAEAPAPAIRTPGTQVAASEGFNGGICQDPIRPCFLCDPADRPAFLMLVGEKFYPTPDHFMQEGVAQGISKRISQIPHNFKIGETVLYLAHRKACKKMVPALIQEAERIAAGTDAAAPRLVDAEQVEYETGIFTAFIPKRIEKIYWQSELEKMSKEEKERLEKRGITPVGVPDGDSDHSPKYQRNK